MCQQCLDAVNTHWPHLTDEGRYDLLMGATSFPFGSGERIASEVKNMAERSGGDLGKALAIADQELDEAMADHE